MSFRAQRWNLEEVEVHIRVGIVDQAAPAGNEAEKTVQENSSHHGHASDDTALLQSAPTVAAAGKEASAPVPMTMTAPWQSGMPPAGVVVGFPPAMPPGMPFMPMAAAMPHPLQQHGMPAPQMMRGLA